MLENVSDLEKSWKLPAGSLKEAIESEEKVTLEIPSLVIRTSEEEEERDTNIRDTHKTEFFTAAQEIQIKEARNDTGLEFEGKTMTNLLKAHKDQVLKDAAIEPAEKVKELTTDLDTLRGKYTSLEGELTDTRTQHTAEKQQRGIDSRILKEVKGDLTISRDQVLTLFNSEFGTELNDSGELLIKKNGQTMKNDLSSPLNISEVMEDFTKGFIKEAKTTGGAGGSNQTSTSSSGNTSLDKFLKEMEGKTSMEINEEMAIRIKAGTLKMS